MGVPWSLVYDAALALASADLMKVSASTATNTRLHAMTTIMNSPMFKGEVDYICCKDSGDHTGK